MILRHCKACRRDRALSTEACSCGATSNNSDTFKAMVVVPRSGGKRKARTKPTLEAAQEAEGILKENLSRDQQAFPWVFQADQTTTKLASLQKPKSPQEALTAAYGGVSCPTLAKIWKTYLPYIELRNRSYKSDVQRYRDYLKGPLGSKPADQIRPADVQAVVDGCIRKGLAPSTTLKVFALLRAMLNYADRMELTRGVQNPCRKVQIPKFDNRMSNPPTAEDLIKLVEACKAWGNQHAARVVMFCAFSGRRMGEVLKLQWDEVDLSQGMVCFKAATTKSGKTQTVPVNKKALAVLQAAEQDRLSQGGSEPAWVFPCSTGKFFSGFHAIWQRIRRASKMSRHYRFHDLRHGFASTLVSNGVSLYMVKELLGHADIKTTERYAHLATGALREAAGVMCG